MDTHVREGELLWTPDAAFMESTTALRFNRWLREKHGKAFDDYESLRRWSVDDLDGFWAAIWEFFEIRSDTPYTSVLTSREMPGARWFVGSRVNYAEHMLRFESVFPEAVAVVHSSELRSLAKTTWRELGDRVRTMAGHLRGIGIGPGDRIVAYMPNIVETLVAMLATTAIGAVWASAAPEFGAKTVIDRFAQIEPTLIFVADGYRFGGKDFDRAPEIESILAALPSLEHVVWLSISEAPHRGRRLQKRMHTKHCSKVRCRIATRSPTSASPKTIRFGSSSHRGRRGCPKRSCTVTSASSWNS